MRSALLLLALIGQAAPPEGPAPGRPPAPEPVQETLHGLRVEILLPAQRPEEGYSLLFHFHGRTGNGKESVAKLAPLAGRGFVLAAPWAKQGDWGAPEIESARLVARDLLARYEVPRERRHVSGLWTGADGVAGLAFDEALSFRTATWIDASWGGGTVPKWARDELHALFLFGGREGESRADRYRKSASLLAEKARLSLAHGEDPEPGLPRGREEPDLPLKELPFWGYFMESMEGRFAPGRDLSRDWGSDLEQARADMAARKTGGLVYVYGEKPGDAEATRTAVLQNEVFFDRAVRHFADQLVPVRLERAAAKGLLEAARVTETPAVVVFRKGGKEILKAVSGEITVRNLLPLLRAAAPDPDLPR